MFDTADTAPDSQVSQATMNIEHPGAVTTLDRSAPEIKFARKIAEGKEAAQYKGQFYIDKD